MVTEALRSPDHQCGTVCLLQLGRLTFRTQLKTLLFVWLSDYLVTVELLPDSALVALSWFCTIQMAVIIIIMVINQIIQRYRTYVFLYSTPQEQAFIPEECTDYLSDFQVTFQRHHSLNSSFSVILLHNFLSLVSFFGSEDIQKQTTASSLPQVVTASCFWILLTVKCQLYDSWSVSC